jgi:hypothetical protein
MIETSYLTSSESSCHYLMLILLSKLNTDSVKQSFYWLNIPGWPAVSVWSRSFMFQRLLSALMQLIQQEDSVTFSHHEIFKYYMILLFTHLYYRRPYSMPKIMWRLVLLIPSSKWFWRNDTIVHLLMKCAHCLCWSQACTFTSSSYCLF